MQSSVLGKKSSMTSSRGTIKLVFRGNDSKTAYITNTATKGDLSNSAMQKTAHSSGH